MDLKYYIKLDALRFFAVFLVILHHWLPRDHFLNTIPTGAIGVTIFFVLSGFLISNILFTYKEKVQEREISVVQALKIFFIRRSLRIFPIYFLFIFFLFISGIPAVKENIWYFVTYTANVFIFLEQSFLGNVSHLWTLAVEEQFYLLWPLFIFLIHKRNIVKLMILLVFISLCSQYVMSLNYSIYGTLVINVVDAFGLGALLAFAKRYRNEILPLLKKVIIGLLIFLLIFNYYLFPFFSTQFLIGLCTVILLIYLTGEKSYFILKIFELGPLLYIGKISYSIYLYHTFIPSLMQRFLRFTGFEDLNYIAVFCINFLCLLILSSFSWYLIENPINQLKRKYSVYYKNKQMSITEPENLLN